MQTKLDRMSTKELGKLFPIEICPYDGRWPVFYSEEKQAIIKAVGGRSIRRIEHIGSTAVPGLKAKPIIDILLEIPESTRTSHIIEGLESIGYHYIPKPENPAPGMMFVKGYTEDGFRGQAFHVHVRYSGFDDEVYFRDYLIAHTEAAGEYLRLKQNLKELYEFDREAYTSGKTEFCLKITALAKKGRMINPPG